MNASEHAFQGPDEQASILRGLLEAAVLAIVVVDERGEIVLVNAAAEALFGYGRGELVGERVEILVPERLRDSHGGQRQRFTSRSDSLGGWASGLIWSRAARTGQSSRWRSA